MKVNIKKIIENIPSEFKINEEILRYIYLELGKIFTYNFNYKYITDKRATDGIYREYISIDEIDSSNKENKIIVTCKQIADILIDAINIIPKERLSENLSAEMLGYRDNEENHVSALVKSGDKNYYMDLYKDVYAIQKGLRTRYYGVTGEQLKKEINNYKDINEDLNGRNCDEFDNTQIEEIDKKLKYSYNGIYIDDAIKCIKKEMQNEEIWNEYNKDYQQMIKKEDKESVIGKLKIDFIVKNFRNNEYENKLEIPELAKFHKRLYRELLTEEEQNKNEIKKYVINLKDDNDNWTNSLIYEVNGKNYYIYMGKEGRFKEITPEEVLKKEEEGNLKYSDYTRPAFYNSKDEEDLSR